MEIIRVITASFALVYCDGSCYFPFCCSRYQSLPVLNTGECYPESVCCPEAKYRSIDGSCSNLQHPTWSQANTTYIRILPARYYDGQGEVRRNMRDKPLPEARKLRTSLFPVRYVSDKYHTLNVMQWGQVVAHDTTHILNRISSADNKQCCTNNNQVPSPGNLSDVCLPITVSSNDYFYSMFNVKCLSFTRARFANSGTCYTYPIEQINSATHVIDGSLVYGSDKKTANSLRSFSKGKLKIQYSKDGRPFLPNAVNPTIPCFNSPSENICYAAGDDRVNQNTGITVYTISFMRVHNNLCEQLHKLNPHWNDETLYYETRKIVGAMIQKITFKDFLPPVIGEDYMKKKRLTVDNSIDCCINYYDPDVNPSTFNEHAGAAYRSFHSLVPRKVEFVDKYYKANESIFLDDKYFSPGYIQNEGVLDKCLRGLAIQPQQMQDLFQSITLADLLFKFNKLFGNDLISTDIQRGRDLGLPPYNDLRQLCGFKRAKDFHDLGDVMTIESIWKLQSHYKNINDVDLIVGGLMEKLIPGTLVGPTFQCIIGEQFYHYMRGDRFYYENCGLPSSFSRGQLKAISQTSLAWILCLAGDDVKAMSRNPFYKPSSQNPIVPCSHIPHLDLSAWKEKF